MENEITYLEEVIEDEIITLEPIEGTNNTGGVNDDIGNAGISEPIDTPVTEPIEGETKPSDEISSSSEPVANPPVLEPSPPIYTEIIQITEPLPPRHFLDTQIDDYNVIEGFLLVICFLLIIQISFRK